MGGANRVKKSASGTIELRPHAGWLGCRVPDAWNTPRLAVSRGPIRPGRGVGGANRGTKAASDTIEHDHTRDDLPAGCQTRRIHRLWQSSAEQGRSGRSGRGGVWVVPTAGRKPRSAPSSTTTRGTTCQPGARRVEYTAFGSAERADQAGAGLGWCQPRGIRRVWHCRGCRSGRGGVWVVPTAGRKPRPAPSSTATRGTTCQPGASRVEYAAFGRKEEANPAAADSSGANRVEMHRGRHHATTLYAGRVSWNRSSSQCG